MISAVLVMSGSSREVRDSRVVTGEDITTRTSLYCLSLIKSLSSLYTAYNALLPGQTTNNNDLSIKYRSVSPCGSIAPAGTGLVGIIAWVSPV